MSDDDSRPTRKFFDEAAVDEDEEEEADSYADSSDEDEDEDGDEDHNDGFFVEDGEEGDNEEDQAVRTKKKRKRASAQVELDEEDFALLEENTGQTFKRGGQLKRLKKRVDPQDKGTLEQQILGDEGDADYEDLEDEERPLPLEGDIEQVDDLDDFIVPERGQEAEYSRYRETMRRQGQIGGISADAAQEIFELFGSKEKPLEELLHDFDESQKATFYPEDDDLLDEGDDDDPEAAQQRRARQQARTAMEANDPTILERNYLTAADDEVKDMDIPEREQLARAGLIPEDFNLKECADWIYNQVFAPDAPTSLAKNIVEEGILEMDGLSAEDIQARPRMLANVPSMPDQNIQSFRLLRQARSANIGESWMDIETWQQDEWSQEQLRTAIHQVLRAIYLKHYEVPLVGMFCKEKCGELLSLRSADQPNTVDRDKVSRMEAEGIYVASGAVTAELRVIRRWDVLWAVYNASHQWLSLKQHKEAKKQQVTKAMDRAAAVEEKDKLMDSEAALDAMDTAEDLEDWNAQFRLQSQASQSTAARLDALSLDAAPSQRRPNKDSKYQLCVDAGLKQLAAQLVLATDKFAENVSTITEDHPHGYVMHEVTDDQRLEPEQVAEQYVVPGTTFDNTQLCMQGAHHLIVCELAAHPDIRRTVRRLYHRFAVVSTEPTAAGEDELDPFHVHGCVKRIYNKPISELSRQLTDQFLHMVTAERKGLLKVSMGVGEEAYQEGILKPLCMLYCSDSAHPVSHQFNELRRSILRDLLEKHLLPQMEVEFRRKLLQQAQQQVLVELSDSLWQHAIMPPLRLKCEEEDSDRFVANQRTMAVCWGPGESRDNPKGAPTHMVMLDARGYPIDMLALPQLSGAVPRSRRLANQGSDTDVYDPFKDPKKQRDLERMLAFIQKHWPHVIVVGASSLDCRQLLLDIKKCTEELNQEDLIDHLLDTKTIDVRLVDETVAALCQDSAFADHDLKEFLPIVRRAVAIGRTVIDPLAVLCSLAGPEREIFSLPLHPLQDYVPEDERWRAIEQVLVTVVSQVGAHLNAMVHIDWMVPPLQFVPGLGPRKARALIKAIKQLEEVVVEERENLLAPAEAIDIDPEDPFAPCRVLRKTVYKNAAPYLRICAHEAITALSHRDFDMQNDLRYHPDDIEYLLQLARITLNKEPSDDSIPNPVNVAIHRKEEIMKLDVYQYNALIRKGQEDSGQEPSTQLSMLLDLQMELMEPYGELRAKERPAMTEAEEFYALSGETPRSMVNGKMVQATAFWVGNDQAKLRMENGLTAVLFKEDVKRQVPNQLQDVLKVGQEVTARISDINFTSFTVRIVTRSDTLGAHEYFEDVLCRENGDPYYKVLTREERLALAQKARGQGRKAFIARNIQHPLFQNVSMATATAQLMANSAPDGSVIIRPSSKATDRVSISIRLFTKDDDKGAVLQHIDIMEGAKPPGKLHLGRPLYVQIGNLPREQCTFEDLDEVHARFIQPLMKAFNDLKAHKKFVLLPQEGVDRVLQAAAQGPDYRLALAYDKPGAGYIAYVLGRGRGVHHCFFTISHIGFRVSLRGPGGSLESSQQVANTTKLVYVFKQHMEMVQRQEHARLRSGADMYNGYGPPMNGMPPDSQYGRVR